jgi:hypothetical protein
VAGTQWEHQPEVRDALRTIVADPELGIGALSSPQALSNLLKDLLPDAPRETSVLVAAAEAGLPHTLADHVARGMDLAAASSVTESAFAARTPFTPEACRWAVAEVAVAPGLAPGALTGAPASTRPASARSATTQQPNIPPAPAPPRAGNAETVLPRGAGPAPPGWYGPPPPAASPGPARPGPGRPGPVWPGAARPGQVPPGAAGPYGGRPVGARPAGARPVTVTRARRIPGWVWRNLEYVHQGRTNMGRAFRVTAGVLGPASIAVSRLSEAGAGAGALPQTLMQPVPGPGPGPDDDSIL